MHKSRIIAYIVNTATVIAGVVIGLCGSFYALIVLDSMRPFARDSSADFILFIGLGLVSVALLLRGYVHVVSKLLHRRDIGYKAVLTSLILGNVPHAIIALRVKITSCGPEKIGMWECQYELVSSVALSALAAAFAGGVSTLYALRQPKLKHPKTTAPN